MAENLRVVVASKVVRCGYCLLVVPCMLLVPAVPAAAPVLLKHSTVSSQQGKEEKEEDNGKSRVQLGGDVEAVQG